MKFWYRGQKLQKEKNMNVIHYAGIRKNNASGVSRIVPEIINAQSQLMNVCFYNYGCESFNINDKVVVLNNKYDDDYHLFPSPFNKPDIVIFHSPFGIKKAVCIAKKLRYEKIPYIIVPHGCFSEYALAKKKMKKWIAMKFYFKEMFLGATAIQFLSVGEKNTSVFNEKAIVIPNGVLIPNLSTNSRFNSDDRINFSYIGRKDIYHKGLDILIKACSMIKEEMKSKQILLKLYGPYEDDNKGETIKALIKENKVEDVVVDCPPVYGSEKERVFLKTDVIVLTSRSEGLPGVVLEAWTFGCSTLLTQGTNMADEAVENNCGWKVEDDIYKIADKIINICNNKADIAIKGRNARRYVKENYNWDHIADMYFRTYRKVIDSNDSN